MTIDEMIATCEEGAKAIWNGKPTQGALEHRQLAEWLKELKALKQQQPFPEPYIAESEE